MHVSERNRLTKEQAALLLAASDMEQAIAAAEALLKTGADERHLARALETAIPVAYMRPFTKGSLRLPDKYAPTEASDSARHDELNRLRDKVYAHTDKAGGRTASMRVAATRDDVVSLEWTEGWQPIDRAAVPGLIELFGRQRDRFRAEAARIQVDLDADVHGPNTDSSASRR